MIYSENLGVHLSQERTMPPFFELCEFWVSDSKLIDTFVKCALNQSKQEKGKNAPEQTAKRQQDRIFAAF